MALGNAISGIVEEQPQGREWFRRGLLGNAIEALLGNNAVLGREILNDFIGSTLGFNALAMRTGIPLKTLRQMFGPGGNPSAAKLFAIIACLQAHEGIRLRVVV